MSSEEFMQRCFELARQGKGAVSPNPMVGALLVHEGKIVAEGFHKTFGGPHAEVEAIKSLKEKSLLPKCALYVSLEPCCPHTGKKTPPCTNLIIESKIPEVLIAVKDPNPAVSGAGIQKLEEARIKVSCGILEQKARELNRGFFSWHERKRPWVILKWAETNDGYLARQDGSSKWISCEESRALVHRWRAEEDAVLVGRRTVEIDDPELTVRHVKGRSPLRVVYDPSGVLKDGHKIFDSSARTLVLKHMQPEGILPALYAEKVQTVIVEGGAKLLSAFIEANLWDEARVFVSETTFGSGLKAPHIAQNALSQEKVGSDTLLYYLRKAL